MSSRVRIVALIVSALLVLAVVGAALVLRQSDDDAVVADEPLTGQPFIAPSGDGAGDDDDGGVAPLGRDRIRVEASSYLQPDGNITYDPDNAIDGDLDTAWNSASAPDDGRGQTMTFRFTEPIDLRKVSIVNGYAKDANIYDANHRIRDLIITTDTIRKTVSLFDSTDEQEIVFEFGFTSKVEIEVTDVFVGSGFSDPALTADLALTEISFFALSEP